MNKNYRALTRAYRPQVFEDIVSQEHVSNTLKNAIRNNRLSHAYMFCGPRGVGKTTMARVLARAVNEVEAEVDGELLGRTLNIVEMDAASNRKIEDVRSLKEVIRVPPQNGKYKIFIIDEVHMLTKEAFNALLKTLEEPPAHAIFIFATTEPHKVLPTILSRVQRFDFKRISVDEIVVRLSQIADKESITIDDESLHVIAKQADGALRDALGLMDQAIAFCGTTIVYGELLQALNVVDKEDLFSFMKVVREKNAHAGLTLIQNLMQSGTDIQEFLVTLTEHIRNIYVAQGSGHLHLIEATEETKKRYLDDSRVFSAEDLMRMLHLVSETQLQLKEVQQPRVYFEILLLKLVHMSPVRELGELVSELGALKKKSHNEGLTGNRKSGGESSSQTDPGMPVSNGVSSETGLHKKSAQSESDPVLPETPGAEMDQPSGNGGMKRIRSEEVSTIQKSGKEKRGDSAVSDKRADKEFSGRAQAVSVEKKPPADDPYGKPSLGHEHKSSTRIEAEPVVEEPSSVPQKETPASLDEIAGAWDRFLEALEKSIARTLCFQVQRVKLHDLKGKTLMITVDNEFARQLIEENRVVLSRTLKEVTGKSLTLSCKVHRENNGRLKALSPYEQFAKVQEKDPHVRTLVELFGAELEY